VLADEVLMVGLSVGVRVRVESLSTLPSIHDMTLEKVGSLVPGG